MRIERLRRCRGGSKRCLIFGDFEMLVGLTAFTAMATWSPSFRGVAKLWADLSSVTVVLCVPSEKLHQQRLSLRQCFFSLPVASLTLCVFVVGHPPCQGSRFAPRFRRYCFPAVCACDESMVFNRCPNKVRLSLQGQF